MSRFPFIGLNQSMLDNMNCTINVIHAVKVLQNQLEAKAAADNKFGADMYAITIIGAFASIIILLMFRSIRPHQSLDDQVTLMMASMQMRVEVDEMARQRQKLRDAKKKAQDWIRDLKERSRRSLSRSSRRSKSTCDTPPVTDEMEYIRMNSLIVPRSPSLKRVKEQTDADVTSSTSTRQSICSAPTPHLLELSRMPARAKSHLGFVPEIVVTEEERNRGANLLIASPQRRRRRCSAQDPKPGGSPRLLSLTRKSSGSSYNSVSPSLTEEFVFHFPDTPSDSPPFDSC